MPLLNFGISIIACVVTFAFVSKSKIEGLNDNSNGIELAFVTIPEALLQLEIPQLWTVLFFVMLFLMGLNAVNAAIQTILTGVYDIFDVSRGGYKTLVSLIACCVCYLLRYFILHSSLACTLITYHYSFVSCSIPSVSFSGQYVFDLTEKYGLGLSIYFIAIFETMAIMWIYGVKRFADDLKFMLNNLYLNFLWRVLWALSPLFLVAILARACYSWENPSYHNTVQYPEWAHGVGWFLTLVVSLQVSQTKSLCSERINHKSCIHFRSLLLRWSQLFTMLPRRTLNKLFSRHKTGDQETAWQSKSG